MEQDMMTVRQAAQELGVMLNHAYALVYGGRLPGAQKIGRMWRIPREAVLARKMAREARTSDPAAA